MTLSASWAKISSLVSEQQIRTLEDKAYLNSIQDKCVELEEEINRYTEEIEELYLKNKSLEEKNPLLKLDYNRELENIPIQSTLYKRIDEQLAVTILNNTDAVQKHTSILDAKKREYNGIETAREVITPTFNLYTNEVTDLQQIETEEKIYGQSITDEEHKITLKMATHKNVFHYSIVRFVTNINELRKNTRILEDINDIKQSGNKLLKLYEDQIENEKQASLQYNNNDFTTLEYQFTPMQLPAIRKIVPSPTPKSTLSTFSVTLNAQKFALDQKELQKIKEREVERQQLLKRLKSNDSFLFKSTNTNPPITNTIVDMKPKENNPPGNVQILEDVQFNQLKRKTVTTPVVKKRLNSGLNVRFHENTKGNINNNEQHNLNQPISTPKQQMIKKPEPLLSQAFGNTFQTSAPKKTPSFMFGNMDVTNNSEKNVEMFSPYFSTKKSTELMSKSEVMPINAENINNSQLPERVSTKYADEGTFKVPMDVSTTSQVDISNDGDEIPYGIDFSPTGEETAFESENLFSGYSENKKKDNIFSFY